jgi:NAD(P)-dependent dehydrogenase (short-subunit alcohol dehydrogenase family)
VAFVTGAGSGIGRATALAFAEAGAAVTIADIALPGLHETEAQIAATGAPVLAVRCDVTQSADIKAALEATIRRLLAAESGREPDLPTLLAGGYEALRPCLAPARP